MTDLPHPSPEEAEFAFQRFHLIEHLKTHLWHMLRQRHRDNFAALPFKQRCRLRALGYLPK